MKNHIFNSTSLKLPTIILSSLACLLYLAYLGQAIHLERALYADGANFFVELLTQKQSWPVANDPVHIRLIVNFINQFPAAVALLLNVEDIRSLKLFFGSGLFLTPILAYLFCFFLSWRSHNYQVFFFSIATLVTCALPSDIFILNQAFTTLALAWVLIHYLLLKLTVRWFDWFIIICISLVLFRAHESLIIWGGVFFIGSVAMLWFQRDLAFSKQNAHIYVIALFGLAQLSFVAFWQMSHPVGEQTNAFLQLFALLLPNQLWTGNTRISLLTTVLLIFVAAYTPIQRYFSNKHTVNIFFALIFIASACLLIYSGASAIYQHELTNPFREYAYRFLIPFGSVAWMLIAIFLALSTVKIDLHIKHLAVIALSIGLISASMWQLANNLQWAAFKKATEQELRTAGGPLLYADSVKQRLISNDQEYAYKYRWDWAWPVFGMSLQDDGRVKKIFKPEAFEPYFQPPAFLPFTSFVKGKGVYSFDGLQLENPSKP